MVCARQYIQFSTYIVPFNYHSSMRQLLLSSLAEKDIHVTNTIHTPVLLTQKLVFNHSAILLGFSSFKILKFFKDLWLYISLLKLDKWKTMFRHHLATGYLIWSVKKKKKKGKHCFRIEAKYIGCIFAWQYSVILKPSGQNHKSLNIICDWRGTFTRLELTINAPPQKKKK